MLRHGPIVRAVLAAARGRALHRSCRPKRSGSGRDKAGHVQYSDLPPPAGTPDQDILARPSAAQRRAARRAAPPRRRRPRRRRARAAASPASPPPKAVDPELEAKRKKAEADAAAKNKAEEERIAAATADNCSRAQAQLRTLESGVRVARTNDKGEREFLDDKQRADETERATRRRSPPTARSSARSASRCFARAAARSRRASFGSIGSGR